MGRFFYSFLDIERTFFCPRSIRDQYLVLPQKTLEDERGIPTKQDWEHRSTSHLLSQMFHLATIVAVPLEFNWIVSRETLWTAS